MATQRKKRVTKKKPAAKAVNPNQVKGTDPRNGPSIEPVPSAQAPKGSPEAEPHIDGYEQPTPPSEPKGSQVAKAKPNPLEGIDFADPSAAQAAQSDPRTNAPVPAPEVERTVESDQANQNAARLALETMKSGRVEVKREPPKLPEPTEAELEAAKPEVWRVLQGAKIARGAATYNLPAGKTITNRDYDIESLQAQGVQLKRVG